MVIQQIMSSAKLRIVFSFALLVFLAALVINTPKAYANNIDEHFRWCNTGTPKASVCIEGGAVNGIDFVDPIDYSPSGKAPAGSQVYENRGVASHRNGNNSCQMHVEVFLPAASIKRPGDTPATVVLTPVPGVHSCDFGGGILGDQGLDGPITIHGDPNDQNLKGETAAPQEAVCASGEGLEASTDWVICPLAAGAVSSSSWLQRLIEPLLTVSPLTTESAQPGKVPAIYTLWKAFRDVANIMLVIVFFAIIFSQATSIGISNYGIKKILPKLAVVAIGANLSFFLIAFVIDVFNIFGVGITDLANAVLSQADISSGPSGWDIGVLGGAAGTAAFIYFFKAKLLRSAILKIAAPIIVIGILAMVLFFLMLALRQIIIIMLVVVSAPAIVMALLPGTESYFKKWWGLLLKMLIMYPIIILLMVASAIAGNILDHLG